MTNELVRNYVDAAIAHLRRQDSMWFPGGIPEPMLDPALPPFDDWIGWKPISSTVTDAELDTLEGETKLKFPPPYREFLKYQHFIALTETGVRFEKHPCDQWQEILRTAYFKAWPRERILDIGLIPFGDESFMDAGPVCFDTRARRADGDCPVVFWDHEWIGKKKEVVLLFSSCAKMFEGLTLIAKNELNFIYHAEDDDHDLIPRKRELLMQFLALDPEGAGSSGREYWTSWGVLPPPKKRWYQFWK